jgi:hypothetical protein
MSSNNSNGSPRSTTPDPDTLLTTPTVPVTVPPSVPPIVPVTVPPIVSPIVPVTVPPIVPPIVSPTVPVTLPPTLPPIVSPTVPVTVPPIVPPSVPVTLPVTVPPIVPPTVPPIIPPIVPPTVPPILPPILPPTVPVTVPPTVPLVSEVGPGYVIDVSTNIVTNETDVIFTTGDPNLYVPQIYQDLDQNIVFTDGNEDILNQIKACAIEIKCEDFHGKGSIDDYAELFMAASQIANQTNTIALDINIDGFNEFATAADELSALFQNFTTKLQKVNIINDTAFLNSILIALRKIVNLSNNFAKFKETILLTNTIDIPKSISSTAIAINQVSDEIDCAMQYITNFATPDPTLTKGKLSYADKLIIQKATTTINSWNSIVSNGVSVTMANNTDIQYITNQNQLYFTRTSQLKTASNAIKNKFAFYNLK